MYNISLIERERGFVEKSDEFHNNVKTLNHHLVKTN